MPEWLIALLNNPVAVTAIGTAFIIPTLTFLATIFMRKSPPPAPIGHDIRDLPENPILLAGKVHFADEEMALVSGIGRAIDSLDRKVERVDDQLQLLHDRIDLLMRR